MSRDFSPRMHWAVFREYPEIYFSNYTFVNTKTGTSVPMFTEEELADRKKHPVVHILASGIYGILRKTLTEDGFDDLNCEMQRLVEADMDGESTDGFPKELTDFYYNRHNHYYHEPNDEEFLVWARNHYKHTA